MKKSQFWAIPKEIMEMIHVSLEARVIYGILFTRQNGENAAWPKQETIANETGISIRTVRRKIDELIEHGLVVVERRGLRQSNRYHISDRPICPIKTGQNDPSIPDKMTSLDGPPMTSLDGPPVAGPIEREQRKRTKNTAAAAADSPKEQKKQPIQEVFDLFHELTGWIPRWNNRTERESGEALLREHTIDELRTMLVFARKPENVNEKYFPKVYKPSDLADKWGSIADKMPRERIVHQEERPWDRPQSKHDPDAGLNVLRASAQKAFATSGKKDHPVVLMALKRGIRIEEIELQK